MPFSLAFSKGHAQGQRFVVAVCASGGVRGTGNLLLMTFETLKESVQMIHVHCVKHLTLQDEVFHNFRLSIRGSLRRPPNVMTWVGTLSKLRNKGVPGLHESHCTVQSDGGQQLSAHRGQVCGGRQPDEFLQPGALGLHPSSCFSMGLGGVLPVRRRAVKQKDPPHACLQIATQVMEAPGGHVRRLLHVALQAHLCRP